MTNSGLQKPVYQTSRLQSAMLESSALWSELFYATLSAVSAVVIGVLADRQFEFHEQSLIFITAVLFVAVRARMSVAVYAAILCFLAYNFFFIHPRYTFYIAAGQGVATVAMFLVVALICGRLANRLRSQVIMLTAANARTRALQEISQRLASAANEKDVRDVSTQVLHEALKADIAILMFDEQTQRLGKEVCQPNELVFDSVTRMTALACINANPDGQHVNGMRMDSGWWCFNLSENEKTLGVICLRFPEAHVALPQELDTLVQLMVQIIVQALARTRLVEQLESTRMQAENERLRAALLSSVSHDLRSPLSTIIGSAESLVAYRDKLSFEDQGILASDILSEGQRLDRYIQNLLDMTRLGHGGPMPAREWVGLDEICGAVIQRLRKFYPAIIVDLHLPEPPPLLQVHPALIEQALINVLENAAKFSPTDQVVKMSVISTDDDWQIDISDRGPGIPESDRERIFEMFYSVERGEKNRTGTGLGLTICQGIVSAHDGNVEALAGVDGTGTMIRIRLPKTDMPTDFFREE